MNNVSQTVPLERLLADLPDLLPALERRTRTSTLIPVGGTDTELYAVAALAGAGAVVGAHLLHFPLIVAACAGGIVCFGLRVMAIRLGWSLPIAKGRDQQAASDEN